MLFQSILLASAIFSGATAQYISGVEVGQDVSEIRLVPSLNY